MSIRTVLKPLRRGPFARYIAGEGISMVGTWMQLFAQGWLLTTLTSHAQVLGALSFTSGVPMLLLALKGGTLADRYDKRLILHASLAVQILSAAVIGWLVATGQIAIWHVFVAAGVLGVAAAFEMPAASAFIPELVPKEEMANAIAIDRSIFHATRLIGPTVGGYLVSALGVAAAYFANAASFLPLMGALLTIRRRPKGTDEQEKQRRGSVREGIAYVRKDPPTRAMVLLMIALTLFVSPFVMVSLPIYARLTLGLAADRMGVLMAFSGVGSLCGSLGLLSIEHGKRAAAIKCCALLIVGALCGMAAAKSYFAAAASLVVLMLGVSTSFGLANIVIQERASDELRGRISSVAALAFVGIFPFSSLVITSLIDYVGMRGTLSLGALGYGCAAVVLLFGRKRLASAPLRKEMAPELIR